MKPRIVFMGTPDFAIPSLEILLANGYPVIAAVSQPDRPKGRGRKLIPPPLKVVAEKSGIPVLQPESVRDLGFMEQFKQLSPDMIALAAFGQIIPKDILDIPPLGCLNVHPSLLP
ncbi:MAG: methionyl-tRNA formyltransferase, partial [Deltaproteobacteria bacterium]|nr:methionyl-tRNA formyltransferase [Deltaproteobacteria bacterium]